MAKLTTQARKKLSSSEFALPGGRYPIEDKAHGVTPRRARRNSGTRAA